MRSGKELILATKEFAKENRTLSWWYTLSTLALLITSLCLTFWNIHFVAKFCFSMLSGLLLIRMFVIFHDHQHHAILNNSSFADFIMKCFGIYILAPSSIWKRSHDFHHKHNSKLHVSDIGSFPTITYEQYLTLEKKDRFLYLALRHPINIMLGYISIFMFSFCINSIIKSPKKHLDCGIALIVHFGFGTILFLNGGIEALLLTLIIPHFVACLLGSYLFYVQHNFPEAVFKLQTDWNYEYAALSSTSYFKMNRIMRWFTGDIGFHHVHHLNSRIPFYRLEETMKAMPELKDVQETSFRPRDIYNSLRLKVWDTNTNRLIGLREMKKTRKIEVETIF